MKIKVFTNEPAHYVPNILFEDGIYKDRQDYITQTKKLVRQIEKDISSSKPLFVTRSAKKAK